MLASVELHIKNNANRSLEQLKDWLRIPSISADSKYKDDCNRAARFIYDDLLAIGFNCEIITTQGNPAVYAEWLGAPGKPTVLVYGHYDVQPVDPLANWLSDPFDPVERDGNIFGRGTSDDKGQVFTHVKAAQAWLTSAGSLPINVKFLIEGEEEIGSVNLTSIVENNRTKLACDYVVISDTPQYGPHMPAIVYGLRGLAKCEFVIHGPTQDLHSGSLGGIVANPANTIAAIISAMHSPDGRILLPGFYDDVVPLVEWERKQWAQLSLDEAAIKKHLGVDRFFGEQGYSLNEQMWARPTFDINGLTSGYQGEGSKTIIPAMASAKVSFRLVPNQKPEKVIAAFQAFVQQHLLPGTRAQFIGHAGGSPPIIVPVDGPGVQAARWAIKFAFGNEPVLIRGGGSLPILGAFKRILGADALLLGWGQPDDNIHSPNEKFSVADFHRGTLASAVLWHEISKG